MIGNVKATSKSITHFETYLRTKQKDGTYSLDLLIYGILSCKYDQERQKSQPFIAPVVVIRLLNIMHLTKLV